MLPKFLCSLICAMDGWTNYRERLVFSVFRPGTDYSGWDPTLTHRSDFRSKVTLMWILNVPYRKVSGGYLLVDHCGNHGSESKVIEVAYHLHEPLLPDNAQGKEINGVYLSL